MEGVKGRGLTCVYWSYGTADARRTAQWEMIAAIHQKRFRRVTRLARFVPVPENACRDARQAAPQKKKRAAAAATRAARTPLEARLAQLEAAPGVKLRRRFGKPASASALASAEKQLGRPLPASLRAVLAEHDGLLVAWALEEEGWNVALEIFSLRGMLKEQKRRGATLDTKAGRILPLSPTYDRSVLGAVLRDRGEAKIVWWLDPPHGKPVVLAASMAALVKKAVESYFVVTGCHDVSEKWLPRMKRRFR